MIDNFLSNTKSTNLWLYLPNVRLHISHLSLRFNASIVEPITKGLKYEIWVLDGSPYTNFLHDQVYVPASGRWPQKEKVKKSATNIE